ncbi:MAG: prkC 34 [Verrucomicrobiales bacterium]|nr:prkC 34 [Verrucomicrobiales bacterium]
MDTNKTCPSCAKPLASNAPAGLCPECLMQAGFPTGTEPEAGQKKFNFRPPSIEELKSSFPQLEILAFIGQGGMGAVYKARQPMLDRYVALKILPPEAATGAGFTERFTREARALARLNHPNIVGVHEFGQSGGYHYLMMEFVDGANLREMERAQRLSPEQALAIVPKICDALQYAHDEGVVHRDIKPENILVDKKGRVKIADFGIAKILGAEQSHAHLTGVVGTPHYMAPEQIEKPQTVDHRADIFSVGVVFYEMLTGELPLGRFAAPSKKVQIDVRLDEVVLRALEKEPEARYQQVTHLKSHVETINTTSARQVEPTNPLKKSQASTTQRPWLRNILWIGAALLLLNFILPHHIYPRGSAHAPVSIGFSQPWIFWIAHERDDGTFERNVVFNRHSSAFVSGIVGLCLVTGLFLTRKNCLRQRIARNDVGS